MQMHSDRSPSVELSSWKLLCRKMLFRFSICVSAHFFIGFVDNLL